jgi:uncharacterized coiled-coil protein SlyX
MEPYEREQSDENETQERYARTKHQVLAGLVALLGFAGIAMSYGVHERNRVQELSAQAATAKSTTDQLQAQVQYLTARLNEMTAAQAVNAPALNSGAPSVRAKANVDEDLTPPAIATPPTAPSQGLASPSKPTAPKHTTSAKRRTSAADARYAQLKAQLDDQQKQLKDTQDQVAKNRSDLEGTISSTRDELNGSIAKTHDELVLLEKRGERNYTEFDLAKGKQFERVGPITLSLRKTDTKHKSYDLAMIVDDNELNKKKVNLYEPVWIHLDNGGQPVQVVVNKIEKNSVHGYVSAPKYKASELATLGSTSPAPGTQPAPQVPQR